MKANLFCFSSMVLWAFAFPIAEVLLQSWGTIALVFYRQFLAVAALLFFWFILEGWTAIRSAPWHRGCKVGGIGFGIGGIMLLYGQRLSDPVTPAIAAAMMPIAGALLEVTIDGRKLRPHLLIGIALALFGGLLATGVSLSNSTFGPGALLCIVAVILFAWATRSTTKDFPHQTTLGQTTITMTGAMIVVLVIYLLFSQFDLQTTRTGSLDTTNLLLLIATSTISLAVSQLLWIRGAKQLGILLASFHMNAVPFYVMVIVVLVLGDAWSWMQMLGAIFVALGVIIAQSDRRRRPTTTLV